ncbi:LamG-like jellyroll fold domain-containing protein [Cohnella abietis]|uniref:Uncharacterized protein n=1 Tax=Cohnella abietis TaxID=2507935 RepID=A0A3T1DCU4_9BACL|nr:LamG-like jellyroll fold domain-containing protein [Cohnella abietis]BBI35922.1 hypothetical protein KCTCHS21_53210 [Cohnella abietis]
MFIIEKKISKLIVSSLVFFLLISSFNMPSYVKAVQPGMLDDQLLFLPFEGSVLDGSGNKNHGTAQGTLSYPAGTIGDKAIDTTGLGSIGLDANKFKFSDSQDFTISFWLKTNDQSPDMTIVSNKNWTSGANPGWQIGVSGGKLTVNYKGALKTRVDLPKNFVVSDGSWHHVVVSYKRSSLATVYIDNASKGTLDIANTGNIDTALKLNIGKDGNDGWSYKGSLDDFRIFKRALDSTEVQQLYTIKTTQNSSNAPLWPVNSSLTGVPVSPTEYQLTWTAAEVNNSVDSIGATLYQIYKNDKSVGTVSGDTYSYTVTDLIPNEKVTFRVEAMDRLGNVSNSGPSKSFGEVVEAGMMDQQLLFLPFEGSVLDASGYNNHGIAQDRLSYSEGIIGEKAADTSGFGSIELNASKFKFGTAQDFSISFWVKTNDPSSEMTVISNKDWDSGGNLGWQIGVTAGKLTVNYKGASTARVDLPKTFVVGDDSWHHVVVSYKRSSLAQVYVDNELKGSLNIANAGNIDTSLGLNIGKDGKGNWAFKGNLDDFRIFKKALDDAEVQQLYKIKATQNSSGAPIWPANSSLTGVLTGPTEYQLTWPTAAANAATDSVGATQYQVFKNDKLLSTLTSATHSYTVADLRPGELVSFRVEAMDRTGNLTDNGPTLSYRLPGISINHAIAKVVTGEAIVLAAAVYPVSSPLQWEVDQTGIVQIDATGNKAVITGLSAGTVNVKVSDGTLTATTKVIVTAKSIPDINGKVIASVTDDTFVQASPSTDNYGSQPFVDIKNSLAANTNLRYGILKYDLSGISREDMEDIESVTLNMYGSITDVRATDSIIQQVTAFGISDNNWNENTITFANMPNMNESLQSLPFSNKLGWRQLDITSYAKARLASDKGVSIGLKEVSGDYTVSLYSKENTDSTYKSHLVIKMKMKRPIEKLWPNGTQIELKPGAAGGLQISWPEAVDEFGIDKYRISMDGQNIATVSKLDRQFILKALRPGTTYTFKIEAGVSTGDWMSPSLSRAYLIPGRIMAGENEVPELDYSFEQSAVIDGGPSHHDGEAIGSPGVGYDPSFGKNVLSLNGSDAYVRVPHQPSLSPEYMSIITAFSLEDIYSAQTIVAKNKQSDYVMEYNPINKKLTARFYVWDMFNKAGTYVIVNSTTSLEANKIYHAVATYDGYTAKLYLNGVLEASQSESGAIGGSSKIDLTLGASLDATGKAFNYFNGKIDFVQLYDKVFSDAAVQALYSLYASSKTPEEITSIRWDIQSDWTVGLTGQAVVKKKDLNDVETIIQQRVIYMSSNPDIASISDSGLITPLRSGTTKLTVVYGKLVASKIITITEDAPQLLLLEGPGSLKIGESALLKAKISYASRPIEYVANGVIYTSNRPDIATVNPVTGAIIAVSRGIAIIHASFRGLDADWVINITEQPVVIDPEEAQLTSLVFTGPSLLDISKSGTTSLQATFSDGLVTQPEQGDGVVYRSESPNVATIDPVTGVVNAHNYGTVQITATYRSFTAGFMLVVKGSTPPVESEDGLKSLRLIGPSSIRVGELGTYLLEAAYSQSAARDVTQWAEWSTQNSNILRIEGPGVIKGLQPGTSVITAVYKDLITSYPITVELKSDGNNGGSSYNPVVEPANKQIYRINNSDFTGPSAKQSIQLKDDVEQAVFAVDAGTVLGNRSVELKKNGLILEVPGNLLQSLQAQFSDNKIEKAPIVLSFPALVESAKKEWVRKAEERVSAGVKLNPVTAMYEISFNALSDNKNSVPMPQRLSKPIQAVFSVAPGADRELYGVYRLLDDGSMKYVGGKAIEEGIRVDIEESGRYVVMEYRKGYGDVMPDHWAYRTIEIMSAKHKVEGVSENKFEPNKAVSRAEFIAMLVKTFNIPQQSTDSFGDVPADAWYSSYIGGAAALGLVKGRHGDQFEPNSTITREEMAVLLVRVYENLSGVLATAASQRFADSNSFASWSQDAINFSAKLGLLEGSGNKMFYPQHNATRAEVAQVLLKMLNKDIK